MVSANLGEFRSPVAIINRRDREPSRIQKFVPQKSQPEKSSSKQPMRGRLGARVWQTNRRLTTGQIYETQFTIHSTTKRGRCLFRGSTVHNTPYCVCCKYMYTSSGHHVERQGRKSRVRCRIDAMPLMIVVIPV